MRWLVVFFETLEHSTFVFILPLLVSIFDFGFHLVKCFLEHLGEFLTHLLNIVLQLLDLLLLVFLLFIDFLLEILLGLDKSLNLSCVVVLSLVKLIDLLVHLFLDTLVLACHV